MKIIVISFAFALASLSVARAETSDSISQHVFDAVKANELKLMTYVLQNEKEGKWADVPTMTVADCVGTEQEDGTVSGRCWAKVTQYTPITNEELQVYIDANGFGGTTELLLEPVKKTETVREPKARFVRVTRGMYEVNVHGLKKDGSVEEVLVSTLE